MLRAVLAACLLCLAAPAAASAIPPGLSGDEPISVAGRTITLDEITHWARIVARTGDSSGGATRQHFEQAAQLLISNRWIAGEAERLGLDVSRRQVGQSFRRQKQRSFPRERGYRRFLRESGQTTADVRARVRLDLTSDRIRRHVIGGEKRPRVQQRLLLEFVADFDARWRAQTVCTPRFARTLQECGNYQTVSNSSS
jgi:hypothetical protein